MNKKSALNEGVGLIIVMIIGLLILFVSIGIFKPTVSDAGTFFSTQTLKAKDEVCKLDTKNSGIALNEANDIDTDERLDTCDMCVCKGPPCNNDGKHDADFDGMPDGCDEKIDDKTITKCKKGFTLTKDGRCTG